MPEYRRERFIDVVSHVLEAGMVTYRGLPATSLCEEHLCNLGMLPDGGFRFHAAPVKVKEMGSFPVRAYAVVA